MKLVVRQFEVPLEYNEETVRQALIKKLGCKDKDLKSFQIFRRSLDARPRRPAPVFVLQLEMVVSDKIAKSVQRLKDVEIPRPDSLASDHLPEFKQPEFRPVVVGAGPAGLMAAYHLAVFGLKPIIIERGCRAEDRKPLVDEFWRTGKFDKESNALFGEGGAGLFSDGKLTARSKDKPRMRTFFETLVTCGAPEDILIDSEPHLGSDKLLEIIPKMRELIEDKGGEFRFNTRLEHIFFTEGKLDFIVADGQKIRTRHLILATGHSARDIYQLLAEAEVKLEAKAFAVGVRLEVPQKQIDASQYGEFAGHPLLKAASFKLTRKPENGTRACYSFCMCPGGLVIACASEPGMLTTNGMSYAARSGHYGNAAFIVPVQPEDYNDNNYKFEAMAGISFQQAIEKAAFNEGGQDFKVPATRLNDFLADKISENLPSNRSCHSAKPADFRKILPDFVIETLKSAIPRMLKELDCVNPDDAILYAAETRSSSPIRVVRGEDCQSISHTGIFPAGEGAGYAGGIVSSAIDGLKTAEMLIKSLA
jgi:uncharacterized FAD-dependent dehydrogenase